MPCSEDHAVTHIPPDVGGGQGRIIILCGTRMVCSIPLAPGTRKADIETWANGNLRQHIEAEPRFCKRKGGYCFGDSHPECAIVESGRPDPVGTDLARWLHDRLPTDGAADGIREAGGTWKAHWPES